MTTELGELARRTDKTVAEARADLVRAVRHAFTHGMTQTQIAREIGRSQPEVSRLLRFHGRTLLARRLRQHASEVRRIVAAAGGSNVRVFGSVATETDNEQSDVDLLFTMNKPLSLMELSALGERIGLLIGVRVDLVPDAALSPQLRDRILAEAAAL